MTHRWFWKKKLPERKGQSCTILARGCMNSILVEFSDGYKVITSHYAVREEKEKIMAKVQQKVQQKKESDEGFLTIGRERLLDLLETVRPGVARKEIVEQATNFVFTGTQVITYNEQICVCAVSPLRGFVCSVQAEEFTKLIKSLGAEELQMRVVESEGKHAVKIESGKVRAEFAVTQNDAAQSLIKQLKLNALVKLWKPVPDDFIQGLKWCLFSASNDPTQGVLTSIYVKKRTIASSDDMRVSLYTMSKGLDVEMLLPASSVDELVKFPVEEWCAVEPWAYFRTGAKAIFCARMMDGQYPDPREFFEFEGEELELPDGLGKALESAEIMAAGDYPIDKRVKITIGKGRLVVFAENEALGWIKTEIDMGVKDCPAVEFVINPIFLREILGKTNTVKIGSDRALFQTDNFRHLVSLHGE